MHRRFFKAGDGRHGGGNRGFGKTGQDVEIKVPVGTVVVQMDDTGRNQLLADLNESGNGVVVATGGRGGRGNVRFASSTNQTPRIAEKGAKGEEKTLILELKLIADVGIIGHPNVGKSTLLSVMSAARPKVADYPFTTLEPVLGVAEAGDTSFVVAEIPGLIRGAHSGKGLGYDFLRHAERTKALIHLVDGSAELPVENMGGINEELRLYDTALAGKKQIVVVNKIDIPEVESRLDEIEAQFEKVGIEPLFISAAARTNIDSLVGRIAAELQSIRRQERTEIVEPKKVFRLQPTVRTGDVRVKGNTFVIESPELERVIEAADLDDPEVMRQVKWYMARLHITSALEKAGIKPGRRVRCGKSEWEW